jgi:hypothetical protein
MKNETHIIHKTHLNENNLTHQTKHKNDDRIKDNNDIPNHPICNENHENYDNNLHNHKIDHYKEI